MKLLSPPNAGYDMHLLNALLRFNADGVCEGIVRYAGEQSKFKTVVVKTDEGTPDEKAWNDLVVDLQPLQLEHYIAGAKSPVCLVVLEEGDEIPEELREYFHEPVNQDKSEVETESEVITEPVEIENTKTVVDVPVVDASGANNPPAESPTPRTRKAKG